MVSNLVVSKMIKVKNIYYGVDNFNILNDINLNIPKNSFVGIIGPNGCGKSTLLKNLYKFLKPTKGKVYIDDASITSYTNRELAKKLSVLTQKQNMNFDFLVEEIIEMGFYANEKLLLKKSKKNLIQASLDSVGMKNMGKRSFLSLSGGEMQRVLIARALMQNTEIIILDEPTNHLDIKYQFQIMDLVKNSNKTVLAVIHDINIASKYCDYLYAMKKGRIILQGRTEDVITSQNIKEIFDVECEVLPHPKTSRPLIIF